MNILGIVLFLSLPAAVLCVKCTRPPTTGPTAGPTTREPTAGPTTREPTAGPTTSIAPPTTTDFVEETTMDFPAPEAWPVGKFSLMMAGDSCPDFYSFKKGSIYQDSEDFRNANSFPRDSRGFLGPLKNDGLKFHFCTKNKGFGDYRWGPGDYCINKFSSRCPPNFKTGNITWDDEDYKNGNNVKGRTPAGNFGRDTTLYYCCRNDGDANIAIDLPVTKPFYMYPYKTDCQKVRRMTVTKEVIQFDDEDSNNQNAKGGAHPLLGTSLSDHLMTYCLYEPKP